MNQKLLLRQIATHIKETTAAQGIDHYATMHGFSCSEWAELTGRDRSTVARNVRRAKKPNPES